MMSSRKNHRSSRTVKELLSKVLPNEIVMQEIFSRLPPESVGISRCISKTWRDSLTDPTFVKTIYMQRQPLQILQLTGSGTFQSTKIIDNEAFLRRDLKFPLEGVDSFVGSCNGLVCLELILNRNLPYSASKQLALWNPATKAYKILPTKPNTSFGVLKASPPEFLAFGYDPYFDDYKVLQIYMFQQVHVYSLKSNTWKLLPNAPLNLCNDSDRYCTLNGSIRFTVYPDRKNRNDCRMVVFRLKDDSFAEVKIPAISSKDPLNHWKVIGDYLVSFQYFDQRPNQYCEVDLWMLKEMEKGKEYNYSWIKSSTISSLNLAIGGKIPYHIEPVIFISDRIVVMLLCRHDGTRFMLFDPTRESIILEDFLPSNPQTFAPSNRITYKESLVSPKFVGQR